MTRRRKISLGVIGLVVIAGLWLFIFGLPWGLHAYTVYQLETITGKKILLEEVAIHYLARNITMNGLQVVDPELKMTLLTLDRFQIQFRIWPLLNNRILLPRVELDHPVFSLIRARNGQLNINQLLREDQEASGETGFHVIVGEVQLKNGTFIYQDFANPAHPLAQIDDITIHIANFSTQSTEPVPIQLQAALAEQGRVMAKGQMHLDPFSLESEWDMKEVVLSPYEKFFPEIPPLSGTINSSFTLRIPPEDFSHVRVEGNGAVQELHIGSPPSPFLTVQRLEVSDVEFSWPDHLLIPRILADRLSLEIIRNELGNLPILAAFKGETPQQSTVEEEQSELIPKIGEIQIKDSRIHFIDQTIQPEYQKQFTHVMVGINHLASELDQKGHITLTASTPEEEIIEMEGEIRLFGGQFFLNVNGTVKEWSVPSFNPYAEKWLGWGSRSGRLKTTFAIQVEEQRLQSKSKIGISDLQVARAGAEDLVDRELGLPLGLIVALAKNTHGEIKLTVEVDGPLNKPEFSIRGAIWKSLRNAVVNVVTAPLRLIGKLVKRDSKIQTIDIHPILFQAGTHTMREGMEERIRHLQRFLQKTPYIEFTIHPLISAGDLSMLRIRKVASRIADLEARKPHLKGVRATQALYREKFPDQQPPREEVRLIKELVAVEPEPLEETAALATDRVEKVVERLTASQGISHNRIHIAEFRMTSDEDDIGGLEFSITR